MFLVCFVYCLRNKACSHGRGSLGEQQSKPNIVVAFGREGGVKSNPTVVLTLGGVCT